VVYLIIIASMFVWPREWAEWIFATIASTAGGMWLTHGQANSMGQFMLAFVASYAVIMIAFALPKRAKRAKA
jgi:hypothetical protein